MKYQVLLAFVHNIFFKCYKDLVDGDRASELSNLELLMVMNYSKPFDNTDDAISKWMVSRFFDVKGGEN